MAFDPQEVHAQEFTDIERQTLRLWFDVDQAGNDVLADAILNAGLQFEHYTSLLPDDPAARTLGQITKQQRLAFLLSEQVSQAMTFLSKLPAPGNGVARADHARAAVFDDALDASIKRLNANLDDLSKNLRDAGH